VSRSLLSLANDLALEGHRGHNKAAVALANKLARCAWAAWTTNRAFRDTSVAA
jgi:hypothetical protein